MKYKLSDYTYGPYRRAIALKTFETPLGIIYEGAVGGWLESENSLSHEGTCWVGLESFVDKNSIIKDNAQIRGRTKVANSTVRDNTIVKNSTIKDSAIYCDTISNAIAEDSTISEKAIVYSAKVRNSSIRGNVFIDTHEKVYNSTVGGQARISNIAQVHYCNISGNAFIYNSAKIIGRPDQILFVGDGAKVYGSVTIQHGNINFNVKENIVKLIKASLNILPVNGKYIFFKRVNKDLSSEYSRNFVYRIGEVVEVPYADPNWHRSCAAGIHCAGAHYYSEEPDKVFIALEVNVEDIITCQDGKVRCRKAKVLGIAG